MTSVGDGSEKLSVLNNFCVGYCCQFVVGLKMCSGKFICCKLMCGCGLCLCLLRVTVLCRVGELDWDKTVVGMAIVVVCGAECRVEEVLWFLS